MRVFYGIYASSSLIKAVTQLNSYLNKLSGKTVKLENLHLTLVFVGEVKNTSLNALFKIGDITSHEFKTFDLEFDGLKFFPTIASPRILYINLKPTPELLKVQKRLGEHLADAKINFEDLKPPHLTLIRLKGERVSQAPVFKTIKSTINAFSLIKSNLTEAGPIYTNLKNFSLIHNSISTNNRYRQTVSVCIYNKDNQVLLIKNALFPGDHWQIPQGGVKAKEDIAAAAIRELGEETKLHNIELIKVSNNKYSHLYKTPSDGNEYIGQEFTTVFLKLKGNDKIELDSSEASDYKWVTINEVVKAVAPPRREYMTMVINELKSILNKND